VWPQGSEAELRSKIIRTFGAESRGWNWGVPADGWGRREIGLLCARRVIEISSSLLFDYVVSAVDTIKRVV